MTRCLLRWKRFPGQLCILHYEYFKCCFQRKFKCNRLRSLLPSPTGTLFWRVIAFILIMCWTLQSLAMVVALKLWIIRVSPSLVWVRSIVSTFWQLSKKNEWMNDNEDDKRIKCTAEFHFHKSVEDDIFHFSWQPNSFFQIHTHDTWNWTGTVVDIEQPN